MTSASPAVALATASLPHPNAGITASLYKPLRQHESDNEVREIRLLLIDEVPPDNAEDQLIVCRLNTCTVAEAQRSNFYALSYVWGDPLDTLPILVNGLTFYATRNLVEALRHVPLVEPRCRNGFWVDAVCVNQSDNHEKRAQVSMMRDIYSGAYETLAWLGPADTQSRAAIQLVNRISSDKDVMGEYAANSSKNEKSPASPRPELLAVPDVVELIDKLGDDSLFTTDLFSRRAYWFRIWTFQEIILGSRVRLTAGTDYCDRNDVFAVRNWALHASVMAFAEDRSLLADEDLNAEDHDHETDKAKAAMIQRIRTFLADIKESANSGTHFHRQIVAFRFTQTRRDVHNKYIDLPIRAMACLRAAMMRYAWDTRDMIFGLCGIEDFGVAIDYDLTVRELFCKVAAWLATLLGSSGGESKLFLLFSYTGLASKESTLELPSWVPDWSARPEQCIIHNTKNYTPVPEKYTVSVAEDVLRLRMHGIYIGTIGSVSKPGIYPGVTQLKEGEPPMTDSEKLQRLADAAEFLTGMDSNAIIDALAAPNHVDVVPTTQGLHAESFIVTLVELLADPYRSGHYTYTTHNTACLIHCLVASGRVSLPALTDDSDPGDSTLSAVGDKYRKEPLDRDDLLCEAAYQFQKLDFQSCFFGDDNLDTDEYVYFRTDDGHSGYAAVGVQPGDVVYMVAGCQDVVVLRPVEDHFKFLALGCIVGLGGHYPVNWDNPPGKVDVINIM